MRSQFVAATAAAVLSVAAASPAAAAEATELLELKNTILNLVDELVQQGVITAEKAAEMKARAALKAREEAAQAALAAGAGRPAETAKAGGPDVVRVPYVPEFVKDEIRADVREELRDEVTRDVVAAGKADRWGSRLEWSGDLRLRAAGQYYDDSNFAGVPNIQAVNDAGGFDGAGVDGFLNTTEDVTRGQLRLRLGANVRINDTVSLVTRLATANDTDPTTRNQRLGTENRPFDVFLDLAYLDWRPNDPWQASTFTVRGGRLVNPFRSTALVFDDDLTFDGLSLGYQGVLGDSGLTLFANAGGFLLLGETANLVDGGTDGKFWWGTQLGLDARLGKSLLLSVGGSYYDFVNVTGERNAFESDSRDWTAPAFIAKGNTVFDIRNDLDPETQLFGLASEFELANAFLSLDFDRFDPVHVILRGDYVQNIGFDQSEVSARVGDDVAAGDVGWLAQLEVGHAKIRAGGDWQFFGGVRRLERDAVLDSFADSDFHGGGTDAKGWWVGGSVGLASDLWLRVRWFSADEVDGAPAGFFDQGEPVSFAPLAIDVLQIDLNAQF
jgi:hypothetical protein